MWGDAADLIDLVRAAMPRRVGVGTLAGSDTLSADGLIGVEHELLGPRAGDRRRQSLAAGRTAARHALTDLGLVDAQVGIGRGRGGEPLWPIAVVGSITHTDALALAVVGWRSDYAGIGIDVERLEPGLSERAARLVCTPRERDWLDGQPGAWRTRIFSAKEAVFKALNPLEGIYLGFGDADLTWTSTSAEASDGVFTAQLLKRAAAHFEVGTTVRVWSWVRHGLVISLTFADVSGRTK